MKEIKAVVRTDKAGEVLDAMERAGAVNVTLTAVTAVGTNIDSDDATMSMEFGRKVVKMVNLKVICSDRDDLNLVEVIRAAACTGQPGDGIISVTNVNRVMKIRNRCESLDAL